MRTTALLSGVAGLVLMSAPAFAQDAMPQTQPAQTSPAAQAQPAQPSTMQLAPGMSVRGSDGQELGKLEGARQTPAGQELTVRGADGQLRGVPVAGLKQEEGGLVAAWSTAEFQAAPAIAGSPAPTPAPSTPSTTDPSSEPEPSDPANPPPVEEPETPAEESPATPTTPPGA